MTLESVLDACRPHDLGIAVGAQDGYFEDGGPIRGCPMSMCTMGVPMSSGTANEGHLRDGLTSLPETEKALILGLKACSFRRDPTSGSGTDHHGPPALRPGRNHRRRERNVLFAYEPVWAIGTGRNASPEDAQAICRHARESAKGNMERVRPGGSYVEREQGNSAELLSQPDVDGALVGGASLKPDTFLSIYEAFRERSLGK